jgi:UDP-N-acetylmuramoyl-tripeptide--D-alanyl-D-alanine ligase
MKSLNLNEILVHTGGILVQGDGNPLIKNVVTKRYKIGDHTLLFDLYNKAEIEAELFRKSKSSVVITNKPQKFKTLGGGLTIVEVSDVEKAYWSFIDFYRGLFDIPIIGITGTCGKTTTKEMLKQIFAHRYNVQATYKSFNGGQRNHRYLLGIDDSTGAAIIEMGVDYPKDLIFYIKYFRPQIRILLNIDVYHLVGCKTPERYLMAKAEILHDLDPVNGTLILNADDENIKKIDVSEFYNIILYYGFSDGCHFQAKDASYGQGGMEFTLLHQNQSYPVFVAGYGNHNVYNALAAIAAAWKTGMDIKEACQQLAAFNQVMEHLEIRSGAEESIIIDDTWNSTPLSMISGLQVLKDIDNLKTKIAILGLMPQLGENDYAQIEYAKMGEKAVETQVDFLLIVGEEAKGIGRKALELGMDPNKVYYSNTGMELYQQLQPLLNKDTIVLLKLPHRVMVQESFQELKAKIIV